jgi:phenylpropionate dioxygenase-like ring-hydroxylating dioxygenase large terminal subunit
MFLSIAFLFGGTLPFWLPLQSKSSLPSKTLIPHTIFDKPFVLYKEDNDSIRFIYDICPHQGAYFSQGRLIGKEVQCPYHGFLFENGQLTRLHCSQQKVSSKISVPSFPIFCSNNMIYFFPIDENQCETNDTIRQFYQMRPYEIPESTDPTFSKISGKMRLSYPIDMVVENVLDMLHISYVHEFGNQDVPLPFNITYTQLNEFHGRTTFKYHSGKNSISNTIAESPIVTVENEFYLPYTTVTRVIAGDYTKIVYTQSVPINDHETVLHWSLYRNFWNEPLWIKDAGHYYLWRVMVSTLLEDQWILDRIDQRRRHECHFMTVYDKTILHYRKCKKKYISL